MNRELTGKQEAVLRYIKDFSKAHGFPPTVRELCDMAGVKSTSTMAFHIENLVRMGYLEREDKKPRTLKVKEE